MKKLRSWKNSRLVIGIRDPMYLCWGQNVRIMWFINIFIIIFSGILAGQALGFNLRNKRQTQDVNTNALDDRYGVGNWPTQIQPLNPQQPYTFYPQNPFVLPPPNQPWSQNPYPGLPPPWNSPYPRPDQTWYVPGPSNPGQVWNPNQVLNPTRPDQTWNPSPTWNLGKDPTKPASVTTVNPIENQSSTTSTTESV